jgi:hypothetical protein
VRKEKYSPNEKTARQLRRPFLQGRIVLSGGAKTDRQNLLRR